MIQALLRGRGGTIETYFLDRQVTSCTCTVYSGDGTAKLASGAVTIDSVATTISTAAAQGDTTLALATTAGLVVGRRYLIGTQGQAQPAETVTVRNLDVSTTTTTIVAPLLYDHAAGAAVSGTRCSVSVGGTVADALWWDGFADFIPDSGDVQTEVVDCVLRKIPVNLIDETDVRAILPKDGKILDEELDLQTALREARDQFLIDLGGKIRANTALGTDHYRRPCALKFWLLRRHSLGDNFAQVMDGMQREYEIMLDKIRSQVPVDADQDGTTNSQNDGGFTVISLERA